MYVVVILGFSSHYPILFAYQTLSGLKTEKLNEGLSVGLRKSAVPILQSALTMIVASLFALGFPWDPAIALIKIVVLASLFSVFHALLVLPVVLAICLKPKWCCSTRRSTSTMENVKEPVPIEVHKDL